MVLRKWDEVLLDVFQRNYQQILLGTRLTGRISNRRLYKNNGPIPLSRAIMKEKVEMARALSAEEGLQIAEDCPFRPTVSRKQVVLVRGERMS